MAHGLGLDEVDVYGQTAMYYAVSENRLELVRKYATKGTPPPIQNDWPMSINSSHRPLFSTLHVEDTLRCASY